MNSIEYGGTTLTTENLKELKNIFKELVIEHSEVNVSWMATGSTEQVQNFQLYKVGTVMRMAVEQMANRRLALNTAAGIPIGAFNLKFTRLTTPSAREMVDAINGTHVYSNMPQLPTTASSS
jgi:hypothetical protein